jgi:proteic killer suppression protein
MIKGFRHPQTERLFDGRFAPGLPPELERIAARRLEILAAAGSLETLRVAPGLGLERLAGEWAGQYAIRIGDGWHIAFRWLDGDAYDAGILDHRGASQ